jgi:hypothetical protein
MPIRGKKARPSREIIGLLWYRPFVIITQKIIRLIITK